MNDGAHTGNEKHGINNNYSTVSQIWGRELGHFSQEKFLYHLTEAEREWSLAYTKHCHSALETCLRVTPLKQKKECGKANRPGSDGNLEHAELPTKQPEVVILCVAGKCYKI